MLKRVKKWLRCWLGIEGTLTTTAVAALAAQERVRALEMMIHGAVDLHHSRFKMKNWAVFAIRGDKRDVVKVVDLSSWAEHDLDGMIKHLEKVAEVRVDSPWGDPRGMRRLRF